MQLIDSRRLMGPNRVSQAPTAVAEVTCEDPRTFETAWRAAAERMLTRLQWTSELKARPFKGGIELALSAPIDVLLAATEVNEWAIASAGGDAAPLETKALEIEAMVAVQKNPRLLEIEREAKSRDIPFLWDDDEVSLGLGKHSRTWPMGALPTAIDWTELGTIPVAMITGTNGKTTTSRLLARMVKEAGLICGNTSTDGVSIDGVQILDGDYTGPVAARTVLRDRSVDIAVLETARGGILRRGLAVSPIDVAVITNVSEDHMGGYGIDDVPEMIQTKAVIAHAVRPSGCVVLNGSDPAMRALRFAAPVTYFSLSELRGDMLYAGETPLCSVTEAPFTHGGRARYNIENALACVAAAVALGLPPAAMITALKKFDRDGTENVGRGTLYDVHGVKVMTDFAHNPGAVDAVLSLTSQLQKNGALYVITGGAGDRLDPDLRAAAARIAAVQPTHVWCRDLHGYTRGRAPNEVPMIIRDELLRSGMREDQVSIADDEVDALEKALAVAQPGDFVLLLVHLQRENVREVLRRHGV